jgi:hypothetical protein
LPTAAATPPAGHYESDWTGDQVWVADTPEYTAQVNAQKKAADDAAAKQVSDLAKSGMGSTFSAAGQYLAANPGQSEYTDPKTGIIYQGGITGGHAADSSDTTPVVASGGYTAYNPKTNQITSYDPSGNVTWSGQKQADKGFLSDILSSPIAPLLIGVLAPELLPSLGAFAAPAVSAGLGLASGQDPTKVLENAGLQYLGGQVGSGVSSNLVDTLGTTGANLVGNIAKQEVTSGGNIDPVQALLSGGLSAGTSAVLGQIPGFDAIDPKTQAIISKVVSSTLQTGNLNPAQLVNAAISAGTSAAANATNVPTEDQTTANSQSLTDALAPFQATPATPETPATPTDLITQLQDAGLTKEQIGIPTPPTAEAKAAEPVPVETPAVSPVAENPAVQDAINQAVAEPEKAQTIEQLLAPEPASAVSQAAPIEPVKAEAPAPEVTPEVQALINQAVTGQQESAQAGQPAIDQQTQQLLSALSGGTDTGVTPAETPRSIDNQIAADEQAKADAAAAQAETDKLAAAHPDPVQALLDQATPTDQTAIDQQTQDLIKELSSGTDTGISTPDTSFKADYSLFGGSTAAPSLEDMGGAQGLQVSPVNENQDVGNVPVDYSLNTKTPFEGFQMPTVLNIDSMGGGQGLTVPVAGGTLTESGFVPDNTAANLGDPTSFINQPAPGADVSSTVNAAIEKAMAQYQASAAAQAKSQAAAQAATTAKAQAAAAAKAKTDAAAAAKAKADLQLATQQQAQNNRQNALLAMMSGKSDVAHIKSYKDLYGQELFGPESTPASSAQSDSLVGLEGLGQQFSSGGNVNDFSVDALLHILRS